MKFEPTLHKLSNGVTVILDPTDTAVANVRVVFKFTPILQGADLGLPHFCEHMLCSGTQRFPTPESREEYMSENGCAFNARTERDRITLLGECVDGKQDVLLDFLADSLQNSLFDAARIEIERGAICDEQDRSYNTVDNQISQCLSENAFGGAFGMRDILGTKENIESFTRKQMKFWVARTLGARNCVIYISGQIPDQTRMLNTVESLYGWLKPVDVPYQETDFSYTPGVAHYLNNKRDTIDLSVLFTSPYKNTYDNFYANLAVDQMRSAYKKVVRDRLRHRDGLVYNVLFDTEIGGLTGVCTTATPDKLAYVVQEMARTAADMDNGKLLTPELVRLVTNKQLLDLSKWVDRDRGYRMVDLYMTHGRLYNLNSEIDMLRNMTVGDVLKYARGFLTGPVSFTTHGKQYDVDIKKIWRDNVGRGGISPIILGKKTGKTL